MTAVIQEEEYLDHLTPTGELIGPVLRSKAHKEGLWHKVIHLWVINKYDIILYYPYNTFCTENITEKCMLTRYLWEKRAGQLLLQKRAACKESFPSMWDLSVGGHMYVSFIRDSSRQPTPELRKTENKLWKIFRSIFLANQASYGMD